MRLGPGDPVTVSDGAGRWRAARLGDGAQVEGAGGVVSDPRPDPPLTVAFALVKGERPELTVQKLTEIGVDRLVPFVAERGVVRWDDAKAGKQARRLAEIARQAAMQCRRTRLPRVDPVATFADVVDLPGAALADVDGDATVARPPDGAGRARGRMVGVRACGGAAAGRLGPNVLRAETAAITAGALLAALRAHLVQERHSSGHPV